MKKIRYIFIMIIFSVATVFAFGDTTVQKDTETLNRPHYHVISANPILGIDFMYESVWNQKNGVAAGGFFQYFRELTNYEVRLYYRRYISKENWVHRRKNSIVGTVVKGIGPMVRYKYLEGFAEDEHDVQHRYRATYVTPGIHFNKRRITKSGLFLERRIGYGFPIEIEPFQWDSTKPSESAGLIGDLTRAFSGLDIGLTIGFAF